MSDARPIKLVQQTYVTMLCLIKQKLSFKLFHMQTCIYTLRKERETLFVTYLRNTAKSAIGISNLMA